MGHMFNMFTVHSVQNQWIFKAFTLRCDFCKKYLTFYIKKFNEKKSVLFVPSVCNSGTFLQAGCITGNQQSENVTQNGSWVLIMIKKMDLTVQSSQMTKTCVAA